MIHTPCPHYLGGHSFKNKYWSSLLKLNVLSREMKVKKVLLDDEWGV